MTTTDIRVDSRDSRAGAPPEGVQLPFDLQISDHRLLVSIDTARALLDRDERDIIGLIELGSLQYAWHIEAPGAGRYEYRIHRDSLRCYQAGIRDKRTEADYYATLFRHSRENIRLSELYRALGCSSQHALELLRAGCFDPARVVTLRGISPHVPRTAVIQFLKSRRLP